MCFLSKYCLSNNGAVPRKQQSSRFSPPSLCRTKHQAPQESTLLFCCCITSCHPATGASGRSPPCRSKQFKSRAGFIQFNSMCQASLLQAFLQCLLLTLRKEHVSNLARTREGQRTALAATLTCSDRNCNFQGQHASYQENTSACCNIDLP